MCCEALKSIDSFLSQTESPRKSLHMSEDASTMACKILGDSFANDINKHLETGGSELKQALRDVQKQGFASSLDYTEASLPIVLSILSSVLNNPDGFLARALIKRLSLDGNFGTPPSVDLVLRAQFYMNEMACRNLGAKWKVKKGFFTRTKIGLELPSGEFVHTDPRTQKIVFYNDIKERIGKR